MRKNRAVFWLAFLLLSGSGPICAQTVESPAYHQIDVADGWEFWDARGLAFKLDKQQTQVFSRELQETQRKMNGRLPKGAPVIPETGRNNYETLQYGYFAALENWTQLNALDSKSKAAAGYLEKSKKAIDYHKSAIDRFKNESTIKEREIPALQASEKQALLQLSLTLMEVQKDHLRASAEAFGSPSFNQVLEQSRLSRHARESYKLRAQQLRQDSARLEKLLAGAQDALKREKPSDSLNDNFSAAQGQVTTLIDEIGRFNDAVTSAVKP